MFEPGKEITRAEAATMMAKILNLRIDTNAKPSFVDSQNQWYTPFIAAVEKAGVVKGKERAYSIQLGKLTEFQWQRCLLKHIN